MKQLLKWILPLAFVPMGAWGSIMVSPSSVNFFNVEVGGFGQSETIYVRNFSDRDLNMNVSHSCYGDIDVSNSCFYLNRNGLCTIRVQFRPRREGYQSCSIQIRDHRFTYSATVQVSGQGRERRR